MKAALDLLSSLSGTCQNALPKSKDVKNCAFVSPIASNMFESLGIGYACGLLILFNFLNLQRICIHLS